MYRTQLHLMHQMQCNSPQAALLTVNVRDLVLTMADIANNGYDTHFFLMSFEKFCIADANVIA